MFFQLGQKTLCEMCEEQTGTKRQVFFLTLIAGSPSFCCRKVRICTGKFCDVPML